MALTYEKADLIIIIIIIIIITAEPKSQRRFGKTSALEYCQDHLQIKSDHREPYLNPVNLIHSLMLRSQCSTYSNPRILSIIHSSILLPNRYP